MLRPLFFLPETRMTRKYHALPHRLKILLTITAHLTLDRRSTAFRVAVDSIRSGRVTRRSVSELLLHLSLFLGYPVTLEGLQAIASRKKPRRLGNSLKGTSKAATARGKKTFQMIYGNQSEKVIGGLNRLHKGLGHHVVTEAYGRIMSRRGLTLAERELINVTVLFIKGFRTQLFSHIRGAIRAGVRRQNLEALASFFGRFSTSGAAEFLSVLESVPVEK